MIMNYALDVSDAGQSHLCTLADLKGENHVLRSLVCSFQRPDYNRVQEMSGK